MATADEIIAAHHAAQRGNVDEICRITRESAAMLSRRPAFLAPKPHHREIEKSNPLIARALECNVCRADGRKDCPTCGHPSGRPPFRLSRGTETFASPTPAPAPESYSDLRPLERARLAQSDPARYARERAAHFARIAELEAKLPATRDLDERRRICDELAKLEGSGA